MKLYISFNKRENCGYINLQEIDKLVKRLEELSKRYCKNN